MSTVGPVELAKRVGIAAALGVGFFVPYFSLGRWRGEAGLSLATPLDDAIPLVPASIYIYAWVYTAAILPLFVVRDSGLFRRVALAYAVMFAIALFFFAVLPVTSAPLRAPAASLDPARFATWGLRLAYTLDPPTNLFPSVHLAAATLAALVTWTAWRPFGAIALAGLGPIAVSICTTKQHYAVDAVAGALLGLAVWAVFVRPYRTLPAGTGEPLAWSWRGPALYLLLQSLIYWAAWLAFRAGFAPWEGQAV